MDAEIEGADGTKIAQVYARDEDDGTWGFCVADANEALIVTAPELLALAKRCLGIVEWCRDNNWVDVEKHEYKELLTSLEREAKRCVLHTQNRGTVSTDPC
jgi:hypothetical protein